MKKSITLISLLSFLASCGQEPIHGKRISLTVKDKFMTTTRGGNPYFYLVSTEPKIYGFNWKNTADYYKADIGKTYKVWLTDADDIWDVGEEVVIIKK